VRSIDILFAGAVVLIMLMVGFVAFRLTAG